VPSRALRKLADLQKGLRSPQTITSAPFTDPNFTMLFQILSYIWIAFMAAVILVPTIVALTNRPKRPGGKPAKKKKKGKKGAEEETQEESTEVDNFTEPTLDFGDEIAQMEQSKS